MRYSQTIKLLILLLAGFSASGCVVYNAPLKDPTYTPPQPPAPVQVPAQTQAMSGSIYNSTNGRFLFEDYRARRIGDIMTVLLEESTAASKSVSTSTAKGSGISMSVPTIMGRTPTIGGKPMLDNSASGDVNFSGTGDTSQSNSLSGSLTVHVVQVLPNGNLQVRGEKLLSLNQGSEVIRISGIVRPRDVTANNTVYSHQIAAAEITYKGKGLLADSNDAGWLTRMFHSSKWPL